MTGAFLSRPGRAARWIGVVALGALLQAGTGCAAHGPGLPPVSLTDQVTRPALSGPGGEPGWWAESASDLCPRPPSSSPGAESPGQPLRRGGLPRQRSFQLFNTGATGPGINFSDPVPLLNGALDPRTGWPFVFLDHFAPRPERMANLWIVQTRDCPQVMGTDPWSYLKVLHFGDQGRLVECDPGELLAQAVGRPVLVQMQGNLTTPDSALGGLLWTHSWLDHHGALPPDVVLVAFDWPSQRVYHTEVRDVNEKCRRAFIAGYHLARFVQAFPPESRICLLGQSYGGRVVPAALHLLGGGALNSRLLERPVRLPDLRPDLHVRAVVIAASSDHHWLDPGEKFDHALLGCEAFLNLYNRRDSVMIWYPLLFTGDRRRALGQVGLLPRDLARLGPSAAHYAEYDIHDQIGREHTLLGAVAHPQIARRIAPYVWGPDPVQGSPPRVGIPSDIKVKQEHGQTVPTAAQAKRASAVNACPF